VLAKSRGKWAWALYDWANSAFATAVIAGFFPVFFKQYWGVGLEPTHSTFWLGVANSGASLVVVALAPLLGAVADQAGTKKAFLVFFTVQGVLATAGLCLIVQGAHLLAVLVYVIGLVGFSTGNVFYDSLLLDVAPRSHYDRVSALGYAMGYLGGGVLFAACVAATLYPQLFGLQDAASAVRASFLAVAIWWAVFSLPLLIWVREEKRRHPLGVMQAFGAACTQLQQTVRQLTRRRMIFLFLLAYWLYIDGVDTIVRMALDYGLSLGLDASSLVLALLLTQFVGFPAALVFGQVGTRLGTKNGIYLAILIYMAITVWAYHLDTIWEFYALAILVGLVQGGVQSLSRSLFARLIPPEQAGQFFGFYNLLGKFAALIGPIMVGWIALATGNPRLSILSILVLFAAGLTVLWFVREPAPS
jgi:UMF1 family MFS transporter